MRRVGLLALSLVMFAGTAAAQPGPDKQNKDNSQFDLRRNDQGNLDGETARTKARAGDCAGALSAFDRAIEHLPNEPTLRRDRGLCHEKLGNTYPALDDLRAYITMRPDAPDGDSIRQKVNALEQATSNDSELESNDHRRTTAATEDSIDVYEKESDETHKKNRVLGPKEGQPNREYDYYLEEERLDDEADRSSLRLGRGVVVGAYAQFPRFFMLGHVAGVGWCAGGSLKYSLNEHWSPFFDFGWSGSGAFRSVTNEPLYQTARNGPMIAAGGEGRFKLDKRANDQLVIRLGLGYEREVDEVSKAYLNMVDGRFAIGFRHVFGESFGLMFDLDGGPAIAFQEGGNTIFGAVAGFGIGFDFGL